MKDFFDIISDHPFASFFVGIGFLIGLNIICDMFIQIFENFKK